MTAPLTAEDRYAVVITESYAGRARWRCTVISQDGDVTRIRLDVRARLPRGWVDAGTVVDVPSNAVVDYGVDPTKGGAT